MTTYTNKNRMSYNEKVQCITAQTDLVANKTNIILHINKDSLLCILNDDNISSLIN